MKKILFAAALAGAAILTACGDKGGGVRMGSLSEFDSLSYVLGANIGNGINFEMRDIPFDFKAIDKGIKESAMGKATQEHDKSLEMLREYFMTKRGERAQAIAAKRAEQDSIRLAGGDSTKVEYPTADPAMFENEEERAEISYAFGNDIGYNISQSGMPIQLVWIGQAMQDVRDGKAKKKSGVKKTESGLLYKVTKEGDAAKMAKDPRDVVRVHYTGYTREGKVFDTSIFKNRSKEQQEMMRKQSPDSFDEKGAPKEADEPAKFPLNRVIKGWTEGLQLVGEGGKITLWIPSDLAYGTRGAGRDIGPNEALQFDVEVIEVIPYEEPAPADSTATTPAPAPAK